MVLEKTENIKISALGGVGELGKNMYVVEINENIYVLDAGSKFPGGEMLGIDIVIPDITYLVENQQNVKGIFVTHGHEEQIGAIPFILQKLDVPVYGTELTLALIKEKLKEYGIKKYEALHPITSSTVLAFEGVDISFLERSTASKIQSAFVYKQIKVQLYIQVILNLIKIQSAFKALILEKWLLLGKKASCVCFQTVQMQISQAIPFPKPSSDKILPTLFIKAKVELLLLHTVPTCTVFSKSFMPHISMAVS